MAEDNAMPVLADCQNSTLKTKLHNIYAEVEKSLPSIDFELSDVSSDEDVGIFQRTLKTPTLDDDDKDLDESFSSETWNDLLRPSAEVFEPDNDAALYNTKRIGLYNNDGSEAHDLLKSHDQISATADSSIGTQTTDDNIQHENTSIRTDGSSHYDEHDNSRPKDPLINTWMQQEDMKNRRKTVTSNISQAVGPSLSGKRNEIGDFVNNVRTAEGDTQRKEERKNMKKEGRKQGHDAAQDQVSQFMPDVRSLPFFSIDNINLDKALEDISEKASVSASHQRAAQNHEVGDAYRVDGTGDGMSLIEKLARLTMTHAPANTELRNIDPVTGAVKPSNKAPPISKLVKTARNVAVEAEQKQLKQTSSMGVSANLEISANVGTSTENLGISTDNLGRPDKSRTASATNARPAVNMAATASLDAFTKPSSSFDASRESTSRESTSRESTSRETVYLDLRDFDQHQQEQRQSIQAVQRVLGIQDSAKDSSSSDDSDNDDMGLWHEQRRRIKQGLDVHQTNTASVPPAKPSLAHTEQTKPSEVSSALSSARSTRTQAQRLARPRPSSTAHHESTVKSEGNKESKEDISDPKQSKDKEEIEKQRHLETARKIREQKEQQRTSRLRLCQRLEALRPTATLTDRQPCAEATPTLFDVDASYEPAPCSLPKLPHTAESVLLTVHLSSNGQIIYHRSGHRSVDSGGALSASYTTLLTWLLSLVPDSFDFSQKYAVEENLSFIPPFKVIGLQQLYINQQLALHFVVVPTENSVFFSSSKPKNSKMVRDEIKDSSPFRQSVLRFLTKHTLHSVCPWLSNMVSSEVSGINKSPLDGAGPNQSTYRPPLPSVTSRPLSTFIQINPDKQAAQKMFGIPLGFFWHTLENEETEFEQNLNNKDIFYETQNTMSLVYKGIYREPSAMMAIFNRVLQEGLDLAGVRLLYPTTDLMNIIGGKASDQPNHSPDHADQLQLINKIGPILAVTLRGTFARTVWLDSVGPADPVLARRTDPNSLSALYGGNSRDQTLLFTPRNAARVQCEITRWFGGRVPANGVIDVGTDRPVKQQDRGGRRAKKVNFSDGRDHRATSDDVTMLPGTRPPATLTATIRSDIFVVFSPLVPVRCLGLLLATCQRRGYQIHGIKRLHLNTRRANLLGISGSLVSVFAPGSSTPSSPTAASGHTQFDDWSVHHQGASVMPSTVLLLNKENAGHHAPSLIENFMVQLSLQGLLGSIQNANKQPISGPVLFHASLYSDSLQNVLGRDFSKVPEHEFQSSPSFVAPTLHSNPEVEQFAVLTLTGHDHMRTFGLFLGKLLSVLPYSKAGTVSPPHEGFELVGIKWLPSLTNSQARELTPYEVGDPLWKKSIHSLTSEPAVVLVLRGIDALKRLSDIISINNSSRLKTHQRAPLEKIMAATPELVYRQAALFFRDHELFADPQSRALKKFLPPARNKVMSHHGGHDEEAVSIRSKKGKKQRMDDLHFDWDESIFKTMASPARPITTVLILKPDAVRKHAGKVFRRIHQEGFSLVGLKMMVLTSDFAKAILQPECADDTEQYQRHLAHLTSAPSLVVCLQRENAVKKLLDLIGPEDPQSARRQSHFLWRGMFGTDLISNALYCSRSYSKSVEDLRLFFEEGLCCAASEDLNAEQVICPAVDHVIDIKRVQSGEISTVQAETPGSATESYNALLLQTNCVLLKPALLSSKARSHKPAYVDILEHLFNKKFELVGAKLVWLTEIQAQHYLHLSQAGSFSMVPQLTCGPSLALVVQRDNAVLAFDTLMSSTFEMSSVFATHADQIMRAQDTAQAHKLVTFLFDELMPGSQLQIHSSRTTEA